MVMTVDYDWLSCATVVGILLFSCRYCNADMYFFKDDNFAPNTFGNIADRVLSNRTIESYKGVLEGCSPFVCNILTLFLLFSRANISFNIVLSQFENRSFLYLIVTSEMYAHYTSSLDLLFHP